MCKPFTLYPALVTTTEHVSVEPLSLTQLPHTHTHTHVTACRPCTPYTKALFQNILCIHYEQSLLLITHTLYCVDLCSVCLTSGPGWHSHLCQFRGTLYFMSCFQGSRDLFESTRSLSIILRKSFSSPRAKILYHGTTIFAYIICTTNGWINESHCNYSEWQLSKNENNSNQI